MTKFQNIIFAHFLKNSAKFFTDPVVKALADRPAVVFSEDQIFPVFAPVHPHNVNTNSHLLTLLFARSLHGVLR